MTGDTDPFSLFVILIRQLAEKYRLPAFILLKCLHRTSENTARQILSEGRFARHTFGRPDDYRDRRQYALVRLWRETFGGFKLLSLCSSISQRQRRKPSPKPHDSQTTFIEWEHKVNKSLGH